MEKTWQTFLNQLPLPEPEFTYDDVRDWLPGELDGLKQARLLVDLPLATHVTCDACEEGHSEPVRWSEAPVRPYIVCGNGIVNVRLERLQRWRVDQGHFATWLSGALTLSADGRRVPGCRIWYLGKRRLAGRTPYFFFAAVSPDQQESAMTEIRQAYGRVTSVLLVAFSPLTPVESNKFHVVDLSLVTSLQKAGITADINLIEDQFSDSWPTLADGARNEKKPSRQLVAHRRAILKGSFRAFEVSDMEGLASKIGTNRTALYAMTRGDTSKFGDDNLTSVLTRLDCPRTKWDHIPKRAPRT